MPRRTGHWSGGVEYAHGAGGRRNALTPMEAAVGVLSSTLVYRSDPTDTGRRDRPAPNAPGVLSLSIVLDDHIEESEGRGKQREKVDLAPASML